MAMKLGRGVASKLKHTSSLSSSASMLWTDLQVPTNELRPQFTLNSGQCFNWRQSQTSNAWFGVLSGIPLSIKQTDESTMFSVLVPEYSSPEAAKLLLVNYFQLSHSLKSLYNEWSESCPRFANVASYLPGVRVVDQDPWECLISFICSSNNNIKRISGMLEKLRVRYGKYICSVRSSVHADFSVETFTDLNRSDDDSKDQEREIFHLYSFPTIESLASASEEDLRALGMGYRASFILKTANYISLNGGSKWLERLKHNSPTDSNWRDFVQSELMQLHGVGRKVADCVALFSLHQSSTVPVDTHVWDIACRDYCSQELISSQSLTPAVYQAVGNAFRARFGNYAGWAHSVLFAAELPGYKDKLPSDIQREMDEFIAAKKELKATLKPVGKGKKRQLLAEEITESIGFDQSSTLRKTKNQRTTT